MRGQMDEDVFANFNSRPCERGDRRWNDWRKSASLFQFTPLREGRHPLVQKLYWRYKISIHAPARGATQDEMEEILGADISIHAPARGATEGSDFSVAQVIISIHAPARGATSLSFAFCSCLTNFNSRPCERGD